MLVAAVRCLATMRCGVRWSGVRWSGVRCGVRWSGVWCGVLGSGMRRGVRWSSVWSGMATIVGTVDVMTMLGLIAAASVVAASMAMIGVAMAAPAVRVAPAGPWTHTQEDAVEEVILPIKALGRAAVRCGFVIAPLTDGWFADFDGNLRASRWRQG